MELDHTRDVLESTSDARSQVSPAFADELSHLTERTSSACSDFASSDASKAFIARVEPPFDF